MSIYVLKKSVYDAKRMAEKVRFSGVLRRKDNRTEAFKIATDRDFIGENCVKIYRGDLADTDHEKLLAWQEHYERLLNKEFDWNKESFAINDPTIGPQPKIEFETLKKVLAD